MLRGAPKRGNSTCPGLRNELERFKSKQMGRRAFLPRCRLHVSPAGLPRRGPLRGPRGRRDPAERCGKASRRLGLGGNHPSPTALHLGDHTHLHPGFSTDPLQKKGNPNKQTKSPPPTVSLGRLAKSQSPAEAFPGGLLRCTGLGRRCRVVSGEGLTAAQLPGEEGAGGGRGAAGHRAVPSLVAKLAPALLDAQARALADAGQQVGLPLAQLLLAAAQRQVGAAQFLGDPEGGDAQPPARHPTPPP